MKCQILDLNLDGNACKQLENVTILLLFEFFTIL